MAVSWRGYGLLGIALPILCMALMVIVLGWDHPGSAILFWALLLASSPVLWVLGKRLNADAEPGDEPHRFMGLALHKVPLLYLGLWVLYLIGKAMQ